MIETHPRPTREQLRAAAGKTVADVVAPGLKVLFCGINPGLYTAAIGHHFGRPGNRFWPALHLGGFTPRVFSPYEERELLTLGCGITNLVARATATADELTAAELEAGGETLRRKVLELQPGWLAVLGIGAYRTAFQPVQRAARAAQVGPQSLQVGSTRVWVLPNPSGLNAHYDLPGLGAAFSELRRAVEA
jgi:double-stranded uracil-DNA glycosylase